jgi:hypothetical protein
LRYFEKDGSSLIADVALIEPWFLGIKEVAATQGADFVVVVLPAQVQIEPALQEKVMTRFELDPTSYDFRQPQDLINEFAAENNIAESVSGVDDFFRFSTTWVSQDRAVA